jgi:hypothetical protein
MLNDGVIFRVTIGDKCDVVGEMCDGDADSICLAKIEAPWAI